MLEIVRSDPTLRKLSLFSKEKSPEISGNYGKLRLITENFGIPGQYRVIIFPSPDRLVRRHPVRVAESGVRSCNSVIFTCKDDNCVLSCSDF
jgi:hypothetical protein